MIFYHVPTSNKSRLTASESRLFFNPANLTAEKKKSANLRSVAAKGPAGANLGGPFVDGSSFVYSARGEGWILWTRKRGRHLLSKPGFVRAFSRASLPLLGAATSADGLTGRWARTSAMQHKRTSHFCWNASSKCVASVQYGELECVDRSQWCRAASHKERRANYGACTAWLQCVVMFFACNYSDLRLITVIIYAPFGHMIFIHSNFSILRYSVKKKNVYLEKNRKCEILLIAVFMFNCEICDWQIKNFELSWNFLSR